MKKPTSLAAALQTFDRSPAQTVPPDVTRNEVTPHSRRRTRDPRLTNSTQAPSRVGKKALIGYFDPEVSKQLKQMALDKECTVQDLLAEALNELFTKYHKPTIAA